MTAPIIALLDNDPAFLTVMHDLLTDEGYRTLRWHACEGADPLTLVREARPDLVIVDLDLGGERRGGWGVLMRLRGDLATTDLPAIVVAREPTPLRVPEGVLRAIRCRVVRKPFSHRDLRDLRDLIALLATIEDVLSPSLARRAHGDDVSAGVRERVPAGSGGQACGGGMKAFDRRFFLPDIASMRHSAAVPPCPFLPISAGRRS